MSASSPTHCGVQCYALLVRQGDEAQQKREEHQDGILSLLAKALGSEVSMEYKAGSVELSGSTEVELWECTNKLPGIILVSTDAPRDRVLQAVAGLPQIKRLCLLLKLVPLGHAIHDSTATRAECQRQLRYLWGQQFARDELAEGFPDAAVDNFSVVTEKRGRAAKKIFSEFSVVETSDWILQCFREMFASSACLALYESRVSEMRKLIVDAASSASESREIYVALVANPYKFGAAVVGLTLLDNRVGPEAPRGNCGSQIETQAALFFQNSAQLPAQNACIKPGSELGVIASGIDDPLNIGSIYRLMACFGATSKLVLIHPERGKHTRPASLDDVGPESSDFLELPHIAKKIASTAVGTQTFAGPAKSMPIEAFIEMDQSETTPLVVLETVGGAGSIHSFDFPARCRIVVGSEGNGVSKTLLASLRRDRGDTCVFIPMPGPHPSLNVATALTCALYEFRRQWPL